MLVCVSAVQFGQKFWQELKLTYDIHQYLYSARVLFFTKKNNVILKKLENEHTLDMSYVREINGN